MLDISSAKVKKVIVHRVGNKLRDEGFHLSPTECHRTSTLDDLLLNGFLAPVIRNGQEYHLSHESDILLNTINHYARNVFADTKKFRSCSDAIAKHLYSCSNHPNIGGGELLVILFDNIRNEGKSMQALGLFRVEAKNDYLDVDEDKGTIQVYERMGISLDKVQKGAIVLSNDLKVFAIDTLGHKTKYWIENFLKVAPSQTPQKSALLAGSILKSISSRVESPSTALEFACLVKELLDENDSVSMTEIRKVSKKFIDDDEINELLDGARLKYGFQLDNDVKFESKRLAKYAKDVVTKARIMEGVSLLVSNPDAKISSIEVKSTKSGLRAVVDIQLKGE
jgi:hypothetical protein